MANSREMRCVQTVEIVLTDSGRKRKKERLKMKKILIAVLALGLFAFIAGTVQAEEKYVTGGFEAAGHVMAGAGFERFNNKVPSYFTFDGDIGYYAGPIGKYLNGVPGPKDDRFQFFVDEVELDLTKSFGENIRLRADLDFGRAASGSANWVNPFVLEQAYATANIPAGNGIEFLLGRFNAPIGFEAVDVSENYLISKSVVATGLRPTNLTGLKLYYAFSDLVDLHFYIVNRLTQDTDASINDIPSLGFRLGFNWGDEGTESTLGVSGLFGPETGFSNKHFTFAGDIDLNWWLTESFALGLEAILRKDDAAKAVPGLAVAGQNTLYMGGLLNLHYVFSDVWDGTLQYVFAKQFRGGNGGVAAQGDLARLNLTAAQQTIQQLALAGGYAIADGAKFKLEGRFDMVKPSTSSAANPLGAAILPAAVPGRTQYVYGAAIAFAYDF